ncbi:PREDICTED: Fanconi anemia group G protein [Tinamus guttatus]|uniref:Fanconi anemia group G protein n=1 Tax=Tinamus guttatus TaxID=94827 RepID=UPI00052EFEC4|nr:PREDICTED: Fanconi anemia group G protein [Tinamus guttatus]
MASTLPGMLPCLCQDRDLLDGTPSSAEEGKEGYDPAVSPGPAPTISSPFFLRLPAALATLPLELTVLYNSLIFAVGTSNCGVNGEAEEIRQGLLRVLEACGAAGQDLSTEKLWQKVLQETQLLSLLRAWKVPAEGASVSLVQSAQDLKEILFTAAAFLQGLQELEAGNLPVALSLLQEAAGGFCSKRLLAQIYTCLSCCAQRMGKPQTALQHLKRALQVDFQCLPALSHATAVYHELGEVDAELQALAVLCEALERNPPAAASPAPSCLIQTEHLVHTPALASLLRHQHLSEVKYLLAQRCLEDGRVADAVEHYLDFLLLLQDGLQQQVPLDGGSALPRLPEVFLEAASALQQAGRPQDAITVCEEVVSRTANLIPQTLRAEERCLGDLLRVQLHQPGVETAGSVLPEVKLLQKIRLLSLIGRGTQFLELGKHREALLDFQYSLQISPGDPAAASYLVQALWKLDRKQEAAMHWQKLLESPAEEKAQQEELGRPYPLYLVSCLKQATFPQNESLAGDIQDYLQTMNS